MRRLRFIPACLAFLLSACNEQLIEQPVPGPGETGQVQISLSADVRNEIVGVRSESGEEIPVDDFWIEIFNSDKRRIYCEKYLDAKEDVLYLNTGDYRLLAKHGDSLGVGFNHAFYIADVPFVVEAKKDNAVSATAKLGNVKAKVVFRENIVNSNFYGDCYALLRNRNPRVKSALKFNRTEDRPGYIPAGELVFEVYAKVDGTWMYYPVEMQTYSPNDFVTFTVEAGIREGDLDVTVKVDNTLEVVEDQKTIKAEEALPTDAPEVMAKAFVDGRYGIIEGSESADPDLEIGVVADGGIQSMVLSVQSDYLRSVGVPESVDLVTIDEETNTVLKDVGFVWYVASTGKAAVLDLETVATSIAQNTPYDGSRTKTSAITLTVTDKEGKVGMETVEIVWELSAESTVSVEDYNIWATRIVDPTVVFTKGDPKKSTLMYKQGDQEWSSLGGPKSVKGNTAVFNAVTGLLPGTPCQFMVVYKDNFFPRGEGSVTTETAAQLGNSGFENWTTQVYSYQSKLLWSTNETRNWYRPWTSDPWWDVNSKKTMTLSVTPQYQEFKVVPTVYYSTDAAEGSRSAQLISTAVSTTANELGLTGTKAMAAGEIFIGTADDNGGHATEGHAFPSRPTSLSFQYKYEAYQDDLFVVTMYVEDADGNVIASKDFDGGTASSGWMSMTLDFDYAVLNKKAAKIYVCFRSTKLEDAEIQYRKTSISTIDPSRGYVGSILWIDNLKLNY